MCDKKKRIPLKEGFGFVFTQTNKTNMVNVVGLDYEGEYVLKGWMGLLLLRSKKQI